MFARTTITGPPGVSRRHTAGAAPPTERATAHAQDQCVARGARGSPLRCPSPPAASSDDKRLLRQQVVSSASSSSSSSSGEVDGKGAKVGIILPDTTSSPRWVTADPDRPQGATARSTTSTATSRTPAARRRKMQTIARQMTADKVKVLMIVDLDPASGAKIEQEAAKNGVIPSTTTGSPRAAARRSTSPSTTSRSARCRARR